MRTILFADSYYFEEPLMLGQKQLARQFAKHGWKTGFVSNPLSPFSIAFGRGKKEILQRLGNHLRNGRSTEGNIWCYVPFTFVPFHNQTVFDRKWFFSNFQRFTFPPMQKILGKKGFSSVDVLWLGTPHQKFLKDMVNHRCCAYRVADNTRAFKNTSPILLDGEDEIIRSSDMVFVTSRILLNQMREHYGDKKLIYCPNGVDLDNFSRERFKKPAEYESIDKPIVLYVGAIGEWFDCDLLVDVARRCPDITFVLIGIGIQRKIEKVSGKNVVYIGPKRYAEIPDYIHHCDCGIIPFTDSRLVQSVNPIKMYEFFSLGKPVISREWEELKLLNSPCFLAKNSDEFVELLMDENTYRVNSGNLIKYAHDNTWAKRYSMICEKLNNHLI